MFRKIMLLVVLVPFLFPTARTAWAATTFNPYRVLLVIGDQWNDPASFVVDVPSPHPPHNDHTVRPLGTDFMQLVVMLKSWCVPFDILRLDQEIMNINHFLGSDNKPLYGCILWAADPRADGLRKQSYGVLKEAVEQYGISLVALSNRICHPVLEDLLGLRYLGYNMTHDKITLNEGCCIVQGMGKVIVDIGPSRYQHRAVAEVTAKEVAGEEMGVIAMQGKHPALTHRKIRVGLKTFWIGGDVGLMFEHQNIRTILRRMIVNAVGYGLHKSWEKRYIIAMDDPGGAQSCYLDHWSYPALTREQISKRLIAPLKKHGAMMVINVVPGFVNEQKRRVELSFQQDFTDVFGFRQNYISTKKGLDDGVRQGVFELQCHGWTHMQHDLDSPPGPWWGAPSDGEKGEVGWYREFGDTRRGFIEVPAAQQAFLMRTGKKWLDNLFGIDCLVIVPGGGAVSLSYPNHTWRLAAREGFGWFSWSGGYLGTDMAVRRWLFQGTPEAPRIIPALPDAHDKGIVEHPEGFLETFKAPGPGAVYMGFNEYVGYMHAGLESRTGSSPEVLITYDSHYCQHFKDRKSTWKLELAGWAADILEDRAIIVDGKAVGKVTDKGTQEITLPAGIGEHRVTIK